MTSRDVQLSPFIPRPIFVTAVACYWLLVCLSVTNRLQNFANTATVVNVTQSLPLTSYLVN